MSGFIVGETRTQATLFPERLDNYISEENSVRVIDVFIDSIDLLELGFKTAPKATGRPAYHPATLLKLYAYGFILTVCSHLAAWREKLGEILN